MASELIFRILITGIGATFCMDIWSLVQRHVIGIPSLNYALVGRWVLWMPKGKFCHRSIINTPQITGEKALGWLMHYATGILFAVVPLGLDGAGWFWQPTLLTGVITGLLTLFAPFLIMQPAFGFGIAAAKTPHPGRARALSIITHLVYGIGLYGCAWVKSYVGI